MTKDLHQALAGMIRAGLITLTPAGRKLLEELRGLPEHQDLIAKRILDAAVRVERERAAKEPLKLSDPK